MSAALRIRALSKRFGVRTALDGVDLEVARGTFLSLFGPNGAGKTTLVRCLATLARPSSGEILLDGRPVHSDGEGARRRLGVVSHASFLYGALTARENLLFYARMFGVADAQTRVRELLESVGLEDRADDPVRDFSRGLKQRCAIARALVHDPELLLFDEPFAGLDPVAADALQELLRSARARGKTILMTSHDLARGHELADRFVVLHRGRVVLQGDVAGTDPEELGRRYRRLVKGAPA